MYIYGCVYIYVDIGEADLEKRWSGSAQYLYTCVYTYINAQVHICVIYINICIYKHKYIFIYRGSRSREKAELNVNSEDG